MQLDGTLPNLRDFPKLTTLELQNNALTGALPPLPASLRQLNVGANRFSGTIGVEGGGRLQALTSMSVIIIIIIIIIVIIIIVCYY
jgi:hypothetical protein